MYHKSNRWYADWRDRHGNRKRKAFTTARAAAKFESSAQRAAHARPKAKPSPSPK